MPESSVMLLDKEATRTATGPELETAPREQRTARGAEDSSITVIESPSLDGCLGILLSRHFYQEFDWKEFREVLHLRVDSRDTVKEYEWYRQARIERTPSGGHYLITADGNRPRVLPARSLVPYETCFIDPPEYERFRSGLSGRDPQHVKAVLEAMYELLFRKVGIFSLNEDRRPILPPDYASLRI